MISFTATPGALAAGADGDYKFVSATGTLSVNGETQALPEELIQEIGAIQNGKITITDNRVQLNRKAAAKIIKQLGDELGLVFETSITGPTFVKLVKNGKTYVGSTKKPVVVAFETTYEGEKISGNIKTHFRAKVKGKTLTLDIPLTGSALGIKFEGDIQLVCKR